MLINGKPHRTFLGYLSRFIEQCDRILDVGTPERFFKELRPLESMFDGKSYVAAGYDPPADRGRYRCDAHQDVQAMTFDDNSFDGVICMEVLEHVSDPFQAARELVRVVRPGGLLLVTVPFLAPYHGKSGQTASHKTYPDNWRFTHTGLELLFPTLDDCDVVALNGPIETRLKFFRMERIVALGPIRRLVDMFDRPAVGRVTSRHLLFGRK